jgi:hypothetical protein
VLADGTYDAIVVDATDVDATDVDATDVDATDVENTGDARRAGVRLELTIVAGPHKGDVVAVRAEHLAMTAVEALGLPARLVVTDQRPEVVLEP